MAWNRMGWFWRRIVPGAGLGGSVLALWLVAGSAARAGAVLLTCVLCTVGGILCGTLGARKPRVVGFFVMLAAPVFVMTVMLPGVGVLLSFVMIAWSGLWCVCAWALRRFGPGVSASVPLFLACTCMALPVAAMPLVRAAATWHNGMTTWQPAMVRAIAHACPFFAELAALRPAIQVDWGTLPGMYAWSGLGQEIPLAMPSPWVCTGLYAAAAGVMWVIGRLLGERKPPPA